MKPSFVNQAAATRLRACAAGDGAQAVLRALAAADIPVRLVGGAVRDALLGLAVKDVDLCTPAPPDAVAAALKAAGGIKVIPTGIEHGTLTAVAHHQPFEITTLRRDVETDGRRAVVAFTDDWREDAARRDFTINAMSATAQGEVFDYFGGLADLAAGRVRFVGDAVTRLEEDVLRLLRFYRFFARYGQGNPDDAALAACRAMARRLPDLSAERVQAEILRLLEAPAAAVVWRRMAGVDGVLAPLGLTPAAPDVLERLITLQTALGQAPDGLLRLIAACPAQPARAVALAERLRLSNAQKARWRTAATCAPRCPKNPGRRFLYECATIHAFQDAVLLDAARRGRNAANVRAAWAAAGGEVPCLPIAGRDLLKAGFPPGPAVGEALKRVEAWWVAADFAPDRAACLAAALRPESPPDDPH
jgi:poly(A) polymerase